VRNSAVHTLHIIRYCAAASTEVCCLPLGLQGDVEGAEQLFRRALEQQEQAGGDAADAAAAAEAVAAAEEQDDWEGKHARWVTCWLVDNVSLLQ